MGTRRRKLTAATKERVRKRAGYMCEYCHAIETWQHIPFTIDHIEPLDLGGSDDPENLALACLKCNLLKSNRTTAIDPTTGESVPLFNPRRESWAEHFVWSADGLHLVALSPIGRVTIVLLDLNRERLIRIREADISVGRHPPSGDPIL